MSANTAIQMVAWPVNVSATKTPLIPRAKTMPAETMLFGAHRLASVRDTHV